MWGSIITWNSNNSILITYVSVGDKSINEKISYKVRDLSVQKIQYIAVVGSKEAEENTVSVRQLGSPDQTVMTLKEFIAMMTENAAPPA